MSKKKSQVTLPNRIRQLAQQAALLPKEVHEYRINNFQHIQKREGKLGDGRKLQDTFNFICKRLDKQYSKIEIPPERKQFYIHQLLSIASQMADEIIRAREKVVDPNVKVESWDEVFVNFMWHNRKTIPKPFRKELLLRMIEHAKKVPKK